METNITQLTLDDKNNVISLFYDSFKEDHYYSNYLFNNHINYNKLIELTIDMFLKEGICYGYYDNTQLVSFILAFDFKTLNLNKNKFDFVFYNCSNKLINKINELSSNKTIYILSLATEINHKKKGYAKNLLSHLINEYKYFDFIVDVSNRITFNMYYKFNFKEYEIEDEYSLFHKESNYFISDTIIDSIECYDIISFNNSFLYVYDNKYKDLELNNETKKYQEKDFVFDVFILYQTTGILKNIKECNTEISKILINKLKFRSETEDKQISERLKFYDLGIVNTNIYHERTDETDDYNLMQNIELNLILVNDIYSKLQIVIMYKLSSNFKISQILDNAIRNDLTIEYNNKNLTINEYLFSIYNIKTVYTPLFYLNSTQERKNFVKSDIASLLMCETIYDQGYELGVLIDDELLSIVNNKQGLGQYDRTCTLAYDNILLDLGSPVFQNEADNIKNISVTLYYIIMIAFESCAIHSTNNKIVEDLKQVKKINTKKFMKQNQEIYIEYLKSSTFWNLNLKYPSTNKSLKMIRKYFKVTDSLNTLEFNKKEMNNLFNIKQELLDRRAATTLNFTILLLTLIQVNYLFFPNLFTEIGFNPNIEELFVFNVILIFIFLIYSNFYNFKDKLK